MSFDTFLDKMSNPTFEAAVNIICAQDKRALRAALQVMSEIYLWNDYALPADTLGRLKNARVNLLKILSGIPTSEGIKRGDIQGN
ncbi:MAG: hypothetical protein QOD84_913 [Acidobacteriaceae bacterium]|jgi:hypothetical protein